MSEKGMTDYALYIDDSGHPDNQPCVIAAGFVATVDEWSAFENEWQSALKRFQIKGPFHMTEFMRERRTDLKRDWILGTLCQSINRHLRGRFLHAVDMELYRRKNEIYTLEESIGAPIALAARSLVTEINAWKAEHFIAGDTINIYVERGSKHFGDIEQVFKRDHLPQPQKIDKSNPRCQPADMLGWEGFHYLRTGVTSRNMKRLLPKHVETFGGIFLEKDLDDLCRSTAVPLRKDVGPLDTIAFHSEKKRKRKRTVF